jgi:hypothetical protein
LEEQLLEGCSADSQQQQQQQPLEQQLQDEVWRAVESRLGGGAAGQLPAAALAAAFTDALTAPGWLSRPALHAALAQLGSSTSLEEVLQGDLADLKEQLPRWLPAAAGGAAVATAAGAAGGSRAALSKWTALLRAYAAAWRRQHLPLALLKLPQKGVSHALLVARQGGLITGLRPAAAPELAQHDTLPPEWQQAGAEGAEEAAVVLQAAKAVFQAAGGAQLARCAPLSSLHPRRRLPAVACSHSGGGSGTTMLRLDWKKTDRHADSHTWPNPAALCVQAAVGLPARGAGREHHSPSSHSPQPGSWWDSRGTPRGRRRRQGRVLRPRRRRRQRGRYCARALARHLP